MIMLETFMVTLKSAVVMRKGAVWRMYDSHMHTKGT